MVFLEPRPVTAAPAARDVAAVRHGIKAVVDPARYAAPDDVSFGQPHSSSAQRRDAFGDEIHPEDQKQHRYHGVGVYGEPALHRVEFRLGPFGADEVLDDGAGDREAADDFEDDH